MGSKTRLIALNLALIAALILIAWQGRVRWNEAQAERRASLNVPVTKVTPPPVAPASKPAPVQATQYTDVASKNLFSKDRNPTVVVEAPKVEPPKVMPPLPVVYGVLALSSGTKAIMAERSGAAGRSVTAGDSVGPFKIMAMDSRKITFEWDGKPIEKNVEDLIDRSGAVAAAPGAPSGPAAPAPAAAPAQPTAAVLGADTGSTEAPTKACTAGDNTPAGTVVNGYKKTGIASPFGLMGCQWVKTN